MLELERLEQNLAAIQELQETPPEHAEPILFDYVLPMLQELLEAQLADFDEDENEEGEDIREDGAQVVEIYVSTYTEVQGFLRLLVTDLGADREIRQGALQLYARIRSEVDGRPAEEVVNDLLASLQPQGEQSETQPQPESQPKVQPPTEDATAPSSTPTEVAGETA